MVRSIKPKHLRDDVTLMSPSAGTRQHKTLTDAHVAFTVSAPRLAAANARVMFRIFLASDMNATDDEFTWRIARDG
jgi:hypothetical protein